jgi:hypothetical protein
MGIKKGYAQQFWLRQEKNFTDVNSSYPVSFHDVLISIKSLNW